MEEESKNKRKRNKRRRNKRRRNKRRRNKRKKNRENLKHLIWSVYLSTTTITGLLVPARPQALAPDIEVSTLRVFIIYISKSK